MENKLHTLKNEIQNTIEILNQIESFYSNFKSGELTTLGKRQSSALVLGKIFENFYTCLETIFLRISQFFENTLDKERWYGDLLYKMTLRIQGIREPVLSRHTYTLLHEFLRFRHFNRYYYQFEYDWDKIEFLMKKYEQVSYLVAEELTQYQGFIDQLLCP